MTKNTFMQLIFILHQGVSTRSGLGYKVIRRVFEPGDSLLQSLPGSTTLQPQVFCEAPSEPSTPPRDLELTFAYGLANNGPMKSYCGIRIFDIQFWFHK